ncbi:30S ribosomal protein S17 [candidate division MSBL1 archaeon SCGC-AAA261G05]|uniref:Small ribosomal subunit protein uS17 n=3 Tax=candidate division MSBL1 TaxID=215777 RepID=A0A133UZM2_9EURY|nr:30S ribosomal protein S17 [candidate division MSBL1 archaeon SCGC-AAA261C02]KXB04205.1 30S ribosomal protein S17 [candidate division MSBL1 archaeon SCGC-AAA261G05]KXB09364.1 30S ribosomal protein S17 [candidate division MSBL1 archaeon SCGC-AAA833K04]
MIDLKTKTPEKECNDKNCPFHGSLSIRGRTLVGEVASEKMDKTVVVEREFAQKIPKYERYERRTSRIHAHNPPCINANVGDKVRIAECRRLSKLKSFVVIGKEEGY